MIDVKTIWRCGLVWIIGALFLVDGSKLLRAQDAASPPVDTDDVESSQEVADEHVGSTPDWFDSNSKFSADNRRLFVKSRSATDHEAAEQALVEASIEAIHDVLANSREFVNLTGGQIDAGFIKGHLKLPDRWTILRDLESEARMQALSESDDDVKLFCGYAELRLDDSFEAKALSQRQDLRTNKRLVNSGLVGGSILALLAVVFGYLKLETATRGFYSRRLQTVSLVAAVAVLFIVYWVGQYLN